MARILAVHGIAQQYVGAESLSAAWLPAIRDGMARAGRGPIPDTDLDVISWGDLFRRPGNPLKSSGAGLGARAANEVELAIERDFVLAMRDSVAPPAADSVDPVEKGTPALLRDAPYALSNVAAFQFRAERGALDTVLRGSLRQVAAYLTDMATREAVLARFTERVGADTE